MPSIKQWFNSSAVTTDYGLQTVACCYMVFSVFPFLVCCFTDLIFKWLTCVRVVPILISRSTNTCQDFSCLISLTIFALWRISWEYSLCFWLNKLYPTSKKGAGLDWNIWFMFTFPHLYKCVAKTQWNRGVSKGTRFDFVLWLRFFFLKKKWYANLNWENCITGIWTTAVPSSMEWSRLAILQAGFSLDGRNRNILRQTWFLINKSKYNECVTGKEDKGSHALNC